MARNEVRQNSGLWQEEEGHPGIPWHALECDEVLKRLRSSLQGHSTHQADDLLKEAGKNSIEAEEKIHPFELLARQIHNPLIYLLLIAALISLITGHIVDASVIAGVVILNTLLGFIQEWRAEGALAALRGMAALGASVLRDGKPLRIPADNVVPGDILLLETGNLVAADARVIQSDDLETDESALTGESEPVAKKREMLPEDMPVADRTNMVWMSTNITGGRGRAVVTSTGMHTEIGRIASEVRSTTREATPLQKRIARLGLILGVGGILLAVFVFGLGILRGHNILDMLLFAVAVAVSAIPEGLPAVISVTLAIGVQRMARHRAIIRRLPAVETLGSTTVICTDKTGTITLNQMSVRKVWADGKIINIEQQSERDPVGQSEISRTLKMFLLIGILNNNARLVEKEGLWKVEGNPSEGALLMAARKFGLNIDEVKKNYPRVAEAPFSSERKFMATLHHMPEKQKTIILVKGAPDLLLDFCSHVFIGGVGVEINDEFRREFHSIVESMASGALRVMAGAFRNADHGQETLESADIQKGLTLAGLWGMIDPPREESIDAVRAAIDAGIRPVMITGDHAVTALAIAKQVGIAPEHGKALTARDVETLDNRQLTEAALQNGVFARVAPEHKLKIMNALKSQKHIVAMTGDGVNDAPALKGADIGVAMGKSGTEVAKEAADMVLMDDNFATIVEAIREGRVIYSNLRRVIFFLLSTNLGEILLLIAVLVIGLDLPLTAVMILWINLVTDGTCTIPLGVEPSHGNTLKYPPRDPGEPILNRPVMKRMAVLTPFMAAGVLALYWYELETSSYIHARTIAFTAMAAFQWFQAFNARSHHVSVFSIGILTNRWLLLGVGTAIVLQVIAVNTSLGFLLFNTAPLALLDWFLIILVSSSIWILDEVLKRLKFYN
ncbi:MAG: HAD-IC family P-type ATPase [Candidatus Omnitrophota bacterium]